MDTDLEKTGTGAAAPGTEQPHQLPEQGKITEPQKPENGETANGQVPQEALHQERQKTKRYTEEVTELRQQLSSLQGMMQGFIQGQQQPRKDVAPPTPPDPVQDPEGYHRFVADGVRQQIQSEIGGFRSQQVEASMQSALFQHGEEFQRAYQAVSSEINGNGNAGLREALRASPNPGLAIIHWHRQQEALREIGNDPAAYRERLKAQIMAEMQNGQGGQPPQVQQQRQQAMPTSFTQTRNAGSRATPEWGGPKPLSEIFQGR